MAQKIVRPIIHIDESKCNGCGLCITACAEGALQLIDGKARLVSDVYCDGLGNCLGECPQGAITIIERPAEAFDEAAVQEHLRAGSQEERPTTKKVDQLAKVACGCPGSKAHSLAAADEGSQLANWPVQLALLPPMAPYLDGADLLVCADCVAFAVPDFHQRFLAGHVVAVGCPKLDDLQPYFDKLSAIFSTCALRSVHVVFMEVPCCTGLVRLVQAALADSGANIPLRLTQVGINGQVIRDQEAS